MLWIILIAIVGFIIYNMVKDHKEDVTANVSNFGGMQAKYSLLIEYLTQHPSSRITKLTNDNITISSKTMTVWIDYMGTGNVEISLKATMPLFGNISKKWKYPSSYSQELIIQEIENFLSWNMQQMTRVASKMSDL